MLVDADNMVADGISQTVGTGLCNTSSSPYAWRCRFVRAALCDAQTALTAASHRLKLLWLTQAPRAYFLVTILSKYDTSPLVAIFNARATNGDARRRQAKRRQTSDVKHLDVALQRAALPWQRTRTWRMTSSLMDVNKRASYRRACA